MATLGMSDADRAAVEAFKKDVIEPSMTSLVVLDFWAEWCGPCKQLTPVLEAAVADYADKGVILAKVNVDEQKTIAAQFRVQSIPTVYVVFQGQIVGDLTQFRTEPQIKRAFDQLLKQYPVQGEAQALVAEIEPLIAMGEEVLASGDAERAISVFSQIVELAPENVDANAGLIRSLVAAGEVEAAEAALAALPVDVVSGKGMAQALSALELAKTAVPEDDLTDLKAQLEADPKNHALRCELAGGLFASGDREGAAAALLHIIAADKDWNDGAARKQLLQMFEAIGLEDPWVAETRRRLSAILFG